MPKIFPTLIPLAAILACTLAHAQSSPATHPAPASTFQIRLVLPDADTTTPAEEFPDPINPGRTIRVAKTLLDSLTLNSAKLSTGPAGTFLIHITFTPDSAKRFATITTDHLHEVIALLLINGKETTLLSAPMIQSPITGGEAIISLSNKTPEAEAKKITAALKPHPPASAPAPLNPNDQ